MEFATEEGNAGSLVDFLNWMEAEPLDINRATTAELEQIPGMSPVLANRIAYFRAVRPIERLEDLTQVEGMTPQLLGEMAALTWVGSKSTRARSRGTNVLFRVLVSRDLDLQPEYEQGKFLGTAERVCNRLVVHSGGIESVTKTGSREGSVESPSFACGLVTEKDPGEKNFLDAVTGQLEAKIPSLSARVIIGDYQIEAGQGLVFSRSSLFSKGGEVTANVGKNGRGIRPSLSASQTWFFRGIGASVECQSIELSLFYSYRPLDATVDTNGVIVRFATDELHQTEAELQRKNNTRERLLGARISSSVTEGLNIGASGYRTQFNRSTSLPGPFGFRGDEGSVIGIDASFVRGNFGVSAEMAQDHQKARAGVLGVFLSPRRDIDLALSVRFYPRSFTHFHGSSSGESGTNNENESGAYIGVTYHPSERLSVSMFHDQFSFPWRTTLAALPSNGNDFLCDVETRLLDKLTLALRLHRKEKPARIATIDANGRPMTQDWRRIQTNYRGTLSIAVSKSIAWKSRVEAVVVEYPTLGGLETGMMAFQDFSFVPCRNLTVQLRAVAFQTISYNSRVYEYEDDLLGSFTNPGLYGKGFRWYVISRYSHSRSIDVAIKLSQTRHAATGAKEAAGAGSVGVLDTRLAFQIDIKL